MYITFIFKMYKCFVLFYERESECLRGTHTSEIRYNSFFIQAVWIYAGTNKCSTVQEMPRTSESGKSLHRGVVYVRNVQHTVPHREKFIPVVIYVRL